MPKIRDPRCPAALLFFLLCSASAIARPQENPFPQLGPLPIAGAKPDDQSGISLAADSIGLPRAGKTAAVLPPAAPGSARSAVPGSWHDAQSPSGSKPDSPPGPHVHDFGRALGYNFTKGLFSRQNLKPLLIGSAATIAFVPFDRKISDAVRGDFAELGRSGKVIGSPATIASLTGGLLIAAPMTKSVRYRSFVFSETQALALANAQVFALKLMVRRTRPDASNNSSFPSAHAANIFALATVTSHYYGKKIGIPLYIVACLVAASRVERGSHFPSDVIFGATLGYISGRTAIRGTDHIIRYPHKGP